jgi:hypothetical protein
VLFLLASSRFGNPLSPSSIYSYSLFVSPSILSL